MSLVLCGCANKWDSNSEYNSATNSNDGLPQVEYIANEFVEKSLWTNISQYSLFDMSENKREVIVALIDVGISEYYAGSEFVYTNYGMLTKCSAKIVPIKAMNDDTISGSVENIIKAIEYAETVSADIAIMSFSTYVNSQKLEEAIANSDMLFVVAAGNEGKELDDTYRVFPTCYGCDKFVFEGGTSFAVPFVVAEAVIIACSSEQELTAVDIKNIIIDNVEYDESLEGKVISNGLIDIKKLLDYLESK